MNPSVPTLSSGDIVKRLGEVLGGPNGPQRHRSHLVAFFGTGSDDFVDPPGFGRFQVIPVKSELELRERVPDSLDDDPRIVFLVPFSGVLPLDIGCMFMNDGRIVPLGRSLRLCQMFGATEVEAAARDSALARFLLESPRESLASFGGRLTLESMWTSWLQTWDLAVEGLSLESLIAWAASNEQGPKFRQSVPADVRHELVEMLGRRTSPAARIVWTEWESGAQKTRPLELGLVFDAIATSTDAARGELRMWRRFKLKEIATATDAEHDEVANALAERAPGAFRILHGRSPAIASKVLAAAEARVDDDLVRAALVGSALLPSAWAQRMDAVGAALEAAAKTPDRAHLEQVLRARKELEGHQHFKNDANRVDLERVEMAERLVAWLATRSERADHAGLSTYSEAERLATWYAAEGGFVDWARRRARGGDARRFGRGVNAVVAAADAARVDSDRAFARALPAWIESQRETQIVAIEHAVDRFAVRFLAERSDRKLLVVLLDGMAWAQAVEIMGSLPTWGLLHWRAPGAERALTPVIASLPTITEVSRAAFFAGKRTMPGRPEPTEKDVERWAAFAKLRSFVPQGDAPRVLLRAEGHTPSGALSSEARHMIADERHRVVAVVVNAIDASLKADTQQRMTWRADGILSLPDLLQAAQESGRAVLLAADHGHVATDTMRTAPAPAEAKARWRPWKNPDDPIAEYEVGFPKSLAWAPPGAHGVILLADDAHRYGGGAHTGEHGGATLAEVVAPTFLIGSETLAGRAGDANEDSALRVAPFAEPAWWYPTLEPAAPMRDAAPPPKRRPTPKPMAAPKQLALLDAPREPHPLRALLEASPAFAQLSLSPKDREEVLVAVDFLARRDGEQAPIAAFGAAMGKLPQRARGLVELLSERLNADGYTVLSFDARADLVSLDAAKLRMIYGDV